MAPLPTGGLVSAEILWEDVADRSEFPFSIPAIAAITALDLSSAVTFFVGENGSGKSTMLEAIAVAAGLNPEGGTRNLRFAHERTESDLSGHVRLVWRTRQEWAFFLRAETFFNTASAYGRLDGPAGATAAAYEGSIHERSHGEQFIDTALAKFQPGGLHLLDEPEAALSLIGQLRLLRRVHDVVEGSWGRTGQFVVATHSPILLAYPGARIYEFDDEGLHEIGYEEAPPYVLTRSFLDDPGAFLHHLFADGDGEEPER